MIVRTLLLLLILSGCAIQGPDMATAEASATLEDHLRGRTADRSVSCVNLHDLRGHRLFPGDEAVVLEGPGSVRYLNRFSGGCTNLRSGLSLQLSTPTGRLCEGEIVQIFDATAGIGHGACTLGRFTPYRRP